MSRQNIIRNIYDQIKSAETQQDKLDILLKYNKESLMKRIIFFAYNPMVQFDLDDFECSHNGKEHGFGISKFLHIFDDIIKNNLNKKESEFACKIALSHINEDEAEIFRGIIQKDLGIGLEIETINQAYTDIIPGYPLQNVSEFNPDTVKKFNYPCVAQKMSHGMRVNIVVKGDVVQFRDKQGKIFHQFDHFITQFKNLAQQGAIVFDGHAIKIDDDMNPVPATDEEILSTDIDYIRFILWDTIRFDGFVEGEDTRIGYNWRFNGLEHMMFLAVDKNVDPVYGLPQQEIVENLDQAIELSKKYPIVLKDFSGTWRTGISNTEVVIKND